MRARLYRSVVAASMLVSFGTAQADTSGKRIALSNNYAGNSWRQGMLQAWSDLAQKAVADGTVKEAPAFTTAENQATEQAAQIQDLVLQGYDAIVVEAASPTALNGAIKSACDAGIVVVTFDSTVTEPCAWRLAVDFAAMGAGFADYLGRSLPEGGNLLEDRGLAGSSVDEAIHAGMVKALARYPKLKIVASVNGDWTPTVAQKAVAGILPSLPKIDGVAQQGGDGVAIATAFQAAGRPMPLIPLGNRYDELVWWRDQAAKTDYQTESSAIAPGVSTLAFWITQRILDGKTVPKDLSVPFLTISRDRLDEAIATTPRGGVASVTYTPADADKVIAAASGH